MHGINFVLSSMNFKYLVIRQRMNKTNLLCIIKCVPLNYDFHLPILKQSNVYNFPGE